MSPRTPQTNSATAEIDLAVDKSPVSDPHPGADPILAQLDRLIGSGACIPFLIAIGTLILIIGLGSYPIYTKGEPREAIRVFDIIHGGGWILPTQPGIDLPWKPPMMYWLGALVSMVAGRVNEWTVRLPNGMLAVGAILLCYHYVRRLFDARTAILSALILATTIQFQQAGTAARIDMTLTFFMELAFFEFLLMAEGLTQRRMLFYFALTAATLSKGPIGAALPVLAALIWIATQGNWGLIRELKVIKGGSLIAIVAGGWYLAATAVGGMGFVRVQILEENLYRLIPTHAYREPHAHSFYYMVLALIGGFLPWSIILPFGTRYFIRGRAWLDRRLSYLIIWLATVFVFYTLPQSKRGIYLLELYPALAAMTGIALSAFIAEPQTVRSWIGVVTRGCAWFAIAAGVLGLVGCLMVRLMGAPAIYDLFARFGVMAPAFVPSLKAELRARAFSSVMIMAALIACGHWMRRGPATPGKFAIGWFGAACCVILASHLVIVPAIANALSLKRFTYEAMRMVDNSTVANVGSLNYDVLFYGRRDIPSALAADATDYDYVICPEDMLRLAPGLTQDFIIVMRSNPTEIDGTAPMLLLKRIVQPEPTPMIAERTPAAIAAAASGAAQSSAGEA